MHEENIHCWGRSIPWSYFEQEDHPFGLPANLIGFCLPVVHLTSKRTMKSAQKLAIATQVKGAREDLDATTATEEGHHDHNHADLLCFPNL